MTIVRVSVVIPCNDDRHLDETLASLADQGDAPPFEVVVADDTPGRRLAGHPVPDGVDVRVVPAPTPGWASANRNLGAEHARGSHLLFVDADDVVEPGYVRAMSDALEEAPLVCARVGLSRFQGIPDPRPHSDWQQVGPITQDLGFLPFGQSGSLGVRADVLEEVGGWDGDLHLYEEADLCWRVQLAGHPPPRFVEDAVLSYRMDTSPRDHLRKGFHFGRAQVIMYERFRSAGMPGRPVSVALQGWAAILGQLARRALGRSGASGALRSLGMACGRLVESVRRPATYL